MLQLHKGKVPHSIKTINSLCDDAELDCFEDFELIKDFEPIKMDRS